MRQISLKFKKEKPMYYFSVIPGNQERVGHPVHVSKGVALWETLYHHELPGIVDLVKSRGWDFFRFTARSSVILHGFGKKRNFSSVEKMIRYLEKTG